MLSAIWHLHDADVCNRAYITTRHDEICTSMKDVYWYADRTALLSDIAVHPQKLEKITVAPDLSVENKM